MFRRQLWGLMAAFALVGAACGGDDSDDVPAPVSGTAEQQELVERYWNWVAGAGAEADPVTDPDGAACADRQADDVWFLAHTFGETLARTCLIPSGTPVFAAVLAQTCSPRQTTCEIAGATTTATLDGQPIAVTQIDVGRFEVTGTPDNVVTLSDEPVELIASGHWVELPALGDGEHTLHLVGSDAAGFTSDVTYTLFVG